MPLPDSTLDPLFFLRSFNAKMTPFRPAGTGRRPDRRRTGLNAVGFKHEHTKFTTLLLYLILVLSSVPGCSFCYCHYSGTSTTSPSTFSSDGRRIQMVSARLFLSVSTGSTEWTSFESKITRRPLFGITSVKWQKL